MFSISFLLTLKRFFKGLFHAFKRKNFRILFGLIAIMLLSGTLFYTKEEGLSVINALYFCIAVLSTVGDPSFTPQTTIGKIFTMIYIVVGTGLFLALIGNIAYSIFSSNQRKEKDEKERDETSGKDPEGNPILERLKEKIMADEEVQNNRTKDV